MDVLNTSSPEARSTRDFMPPTEGVTLKNELAQGPAQGSPGAGAPPRAAAGAAPARGMV